MVVKCVHKIANISTTNSHVIKTLILPDSELNFAHFKKNHEMEGVGKPPLAGGVAKGSQLLFKLHLRCLKILVLWV